MKTDRIQMRISRTLKKNAEKLAKSKGLTLSSLVTVLLQQACEDEAQARIAAQDAAEVQQI